ncbi:MAG TPA: ATP-binding cassette domain-containing protein, partial [Nocardioides sp.]|nr:ATP-binding cassette domain-containing protein [Nocardioides sp.]
MTTVLQLTDVTRVHGAAPNQIQALRGISFSAYAGELVAVMGPSGSGKSTLLTIAGGLDQPTSGVVSVEGTDLAGLGQKGRARMRRTSIGYVFQGFNLIPALTAAENVALPRELDGVAARVARREARAALEEVGIGDLADRFPDDMSGGQQQRSATMSALQDYTRLKRRAADGDRPAD